MSEIRKKYILKLVGRSIIFALCALACALAPQAFSILNGLNFFRGWSVFHLLWLVWVLDMVQQILPIRNKLPLGSMKLFANRFQPIRDKINHQALRDYIISTTKAAYKVFLIWIALILAIGGLYFGGIIGKVGLFMFSVCFYVCDLICVLVWCPFRLMMGNRCCTTCRIFNWDHLMMFSPLIYLKSFYAWSLILMSVLVVIIWEVQIYCHPERFWEGANDALKCRECTDKLCLRYSTMFKK